MHICRARASVHLVTNVSTSTQTRMEGGADSNFQDTKLIVAILVEDKKWIDSRGRECLYSGEVDQDDNLCGYGTAIPVLKPGYMGEVRRSNRKIEGTFFDGYEHGISESLHKNNLFLTIISDRNKSTRQRWNR